MFSQDEKIWTEEDLKELSRNLAVLSESSVREFYQRAYIEQGAVTVRYETQTNRAKVLAALNTVCPSCGYSISPAEIVRLDSERMRCPKCGKIFKAGNPDLYRKRTERGH